MKSAGFHEINWIPWNPPDFMLESGGFHEIDPKWAKDQWSYFFHSLCKYELAKKNNNKQNNMEDIAKFITINSN